MRTIILAFSILLPACDALEPAAFRQGPSDPLPPNVALPPELDLCVTRVDLCVARAEAKTCGLASEDTRGACSVAFDDCAYDLDGYHDPSCRMTYAMCRLELSDASPKWYRLLCKQAAATCAD